MAGFAVDRLDDLAARRSPRVKQRTALADVAALLAASPAKDAMPARLGAALVDRTDPAEGFPETAFVALAMPAAKARDAAAERVVDWLAAASDVAGPVDRILALGEPASEAVARAVVARDPALTARLAGAAKTRLEAAAASLEAGLKNPDYPDAVKTRLKAARGSHTKRWAALSAQLGVPAGRFGR